MLDVHPSHHAATTWREFFIHIATIVLGLCIAVGLEQIVEMIHHANERHAVISEVREEAEGNIPTLNKDIDILLSEAEWDAAAIAVIGHRTARDGMVQAVLPAHQDFGHNRVPNRSAWTLATNNGTAALLPKVRARVYESMDGNAAQVWKAVEARNTAYVAMRRLELQLQTKFVPGSTLAIPESEVHAVVERLASRAAALQYEAERDGILAGDCEAVARDILDPRSVGDFVGKDATAVMDRIGRTF